MQDWPPRPQPGVAGRRGESGRKFYAPPELPTESHPRSQPREMRQHQRRQAMRGTRRRQPTRENRRPRWPVLIDRPLTPSRRSRSLEPALRMRFAPSPLPPRAPRLGTAPGYRRSSCRPPIGCAQPRLSLMPPGYAPPGRSRSFAERRDFGGLYKRQTKPLQGKAPGWFLERESSSRQFSKLAVRAHAPRPDLKLSCLFSSKVPVRGLNPHWPFRRRFWRRLLTFFHRLEGNFSAVREPSHTYVGVQDRAGGCIRR